MNPLIAKLEQIALGSNKVEPQVSVWWLYDGYIYDFATCEVSEGKKEANVYVTARKDHSQEWSKMVRKFPELKAVEYFSVPRGRTVYRTDTDIMEVWGCPKLLENKTFQKVLIETFWLDKNKTKFITDDADITSHYSGHHGPTDHILEYSLEIFNRKN